MSWVEERRAERRWRKHNDAEVLEGRCHCGREAVIYVPSHNTVGRVPCLIARCMIHQREPITTVSTVLRAHTEGHAT